MLLLRFIDIDEYLLLLSTLSKKSDSVAMLGDKVRDEKRWSEETMQTFLDTHMRTPYLSNQQQKKS